MKMRWRTLGLLLFLTLPVQGQVASGGISAASATCGTTNSTACVFINLSNTAATVSVQVTGTWSATLEPEKTTDGSTWVSAGSSITGSGVTTYNVAALTGFRVRGDAYTSGTAAVTIKQSNAVLTTSGGTLSGGTDTYIAYWTSASTLGADGGCTYNSGTDTWDCVNLLRGGEAVATNGGVGWTAGRMLFASAATEAETPIAITRSGNDLILPGGLSLPGPLVVGGSTDTFPAIFILSNPNQTFTNASIITPQDFTTLGDIPAGWLVSGHCVHLDLGYISVIGTSTATRTLYLKLGGVTVYTSASTNITDGLGTRANAKSFLICGTAAAGPAVAVNVFILTGGLSQTDELGVSITAQPVTLATDGALAVVPGVTYSSTNGGAESTTLNLGIARKLRAPGT